jgi:hypothetical protein
MIKIEVTDTFGGEANYSWVKRFELDPVEQSDLKLMHRIKKVIGWTGLKCDVERHPDLWVLRPRGICVVAFVNLWGDQ